MRQRSKNEDERPTIEVIGTVAQQENLDTNSQVVERRGFHLDLKRSAKRARRAGAGLMAVAVLGLPGSNQILDTSSETTETQTEQIPDQTAAEQKVATEAFVVQQRVLEDMRSGKEVKIFWGTVNYRDNGNTDIGFSLLNPVVYTRKDMKVESTTGNRDNEPFAVVGFMTGYKDNSNDPYKKIIPLATIAESNLGNLEFVGHDGHRFMTPAPDDLNDNYRISNHYASSILGVNVQVDTMTAHVAAADQTCVGEMNFLEGQAPEELELVTMNFAG